MEFGGEGGFACCCIGYRGIWGRGRVCLLLYRLSWNLGAGRVCLLLNRLLWNLGAGAGLLVAV